MNRFPTVLSTLLALSLAAQAQPTPGPQPLPPESEIPHFEGTALSGRPVTRADLVVDEATVLVVTPSRDASEQTEQWGERLEKIDPERRRVRGVIALDLPFFISEGYALSKARDEVPRQYWDRTWLVNEGPLEEALDIPPDSAEAHVLVLGAKGQVLARVHGPPTPQKVTALEAVMQAPLDR